MNKKSDKTFVDYLMSIAHPISKNMRYKSKNMRYGSNNLRYGKKMKNSNISKHKSMYL